VTGLELFIETTGRDAQNWATLTDVSRRSWEQRAAGSHAFIPSEHVNQIEEAPAEKIAVPAPALPARPAQPSEIPGGAKTVINRLKKHGWTVETLYARGPWVSHTGEPDMYNPFEVTSAGVASRTPDIVAVTGSILVRARRGSEKLAAMWVLRPGLKSPKFKLQFAYTNSTPAGQCTGHIDSKQLKLITESEPT
jgi:hypothetical protein